MSTTGPSQALEAALDATVDATASVQVVAVQLELELDAVEANSVGSPGSDELSLPTTAKVFVLTRLWRSIARPRPPPSPAHLGHSAQVLFQVLTGGASAAPTPAVGSSSKRRLRKSSTTARPPSHPLHPSTPLLSSAEISTSEGVRFRDSHPPPKITRKAVKKLKSDLLRQVRTGALVAPSRAPDRI